MEEVYVLIGQYEGDDLLYVSVYETLDGAVKELNFAYENDRTIVGPLIETISEKFRFAIEKGDIKHFEYEDARSLKCHFSIRASRVWD